MKNKIYFLAAVLLLGVIFTGIYNQMAVITPQNAFFQIKDQSTLKGNAADVKLNLKKDSYLLSVHYIFKADQPKEIFFNGVKFIPLIIRKRNREINYISLPKEIVKDGDNLLTVKFLRAYPDSFVFKIQNYYFILFDSVYTLFPDSINLPVGKGFGDRLHKNVISRRFFWHLIFLGCIFTGFVVFAKKLWGDIAQRPLLIDDNDGKKYKVQCISKIIFFGFIAGVLFHWIKGLVLGFNYPYNTFLFDPADRFHDFLGPYSQAKDLQHYLLVNNYYPVANAVFYFFTFLPKVDSLTLFLMVVVLSFFYINVFNLALKDRKEYITNAFIFSFLTYPFLFAVDRANIEIFLFTFLYFFIYFYTQRRFILSAVLLFLAIGMKAYPAVFLVLLLSEKKYRVLFLVVMFVALAVFGSLFFNKGALPANFNLMRSVFNANSYPFTMQNNILQRGVSIFTLFKLIFIQLNLIGTIDMVKFLAVYLKTAFCLFLVLAGYVIFIEKEFWKKTAILTFAILLLPHISADYKLIHIFIPMLIFINQPKRGKSDLFYAIMFGLLLIPKDYYIFSKVISDSGVKDISVAVVLNILIMLVMAGVIIKDGLVQWFKKAKPVRKRKLI